MVTVRLDGDANKSITEVYTVKDGEAALINGDTPIESQIGHYDDTMRVGYEWRDDDLYIYQTDCHCMTEWEGGYNYTYLGVYLVSGERVINLTGISEYDDVRDEEKQISALMGAGYVDYSAKGYITRLDELFETFVAEGDFSWAFPEVAQRNPFMSRLGDLSGSITDIAGIFIMQSRENGLEESAPYTVFEAPCYLDFYGERY